MERTHACTMSATKYTDVGLIRMSQMNSTSTRSPRSSRTTNRSVSSSGLFGTANLTVCPTCNSVCVLEVILIMYTLNQMVCEPLGGARRRGWPLKHGTNSRIWAKAGRRLERNRSDAVRNQPWDFFAEAKTGMPIPGARRRAWSLRDCRRAGTLQATLALRASLVARPTAVVWWGCGLLCRPTVSRRSRRQGLRERGALPCALRSSSNPDRCAAT